MRRKGLLFVLVLGFVSVVGAAQFACGAGFALYEGSARGNALGGALVGRADDPSACTTTPRALPSCRGCNGSGRHSDHARDHRARVGDVFQCYGQRVGTAAFLYHISVFRQTVVRCRCVLSIRPRVEFDPNWPGRFNNIKTVITSVDLNPNIAWKMTDTLSVAVASISCISTSI